MTTYITKAGLAKLEEELKELKTIKRQEIAERLRGAIAHGDLSENFDYHNAKEEQEMLERKIIEIGEKIRTATIVGEKNEGDQIQIGSLVELKDAGEKLEYLIVTAPEADPLSGKISVESPIGSALLGKKKGETVPINTPDGRINCVIIKVS